MAEEGLQGRIIAAHGRHYRVRLATGETRHCYPRGKRAGPAVGDQVLIRPEGQAEGVIIQILPRRNLLFRSDANRSKQFAANLDQILVVVAPEPVFSEELVGRALVAAYDAGIPVQIVLNKSDLPALAVAHERLRAIIGPDVPITELCALDPLQVQARFMPLVGQRSTLLLGQSGMGKSTLLNTAIPGTDATTRAYSDALGTGRHTTTQTRSFDLPDGGDLIDSPGFQAFGLQHLERQAIEGGFAGFAAAAAHCRFYNCTHRHEPGCGVLAAVQSGEIPAQRHAIYVRILSENEAARRLAPKPPESDRNCATESPSRPR